MSMNKEIQLEIINKFNPMHDDYHTGVRDVKDIKTYQEAMDVAAYDGYDLEEGFTPDYDGNVIENALKTGKITVYSSYPITQGTFVTPSKMEAQSYAGHSGRVYQKEVSLEDVAWIDGIEGQYANVRQYEKTNYSYDAVIENIALNIVDRYSIVPDIDEDYSSSASDFDLVKFREDTCDDLGISPYMFISDNLRYEYGYEFQNEYNVQPSRLELFIDCLAKRIYEMCRSDIAELDRFDREINNIISKYFDKYKMDTLNEIYEKSDLYDKVGRDKFIEVRAKKWDKILKDDAKAITYDVVLSGLYDENSSANKELTEKVILPELSKIIATFERDNLEQGAKKRELDNARFYGDDR